MCDLAPADFRRRKRFGKSNPYPNSHADFQCCGDALCLEPEHQLHPAFQQCGYVQRQCCPAGVISGAATQLNSPRHIFVDKATDGLFVANQGNASVLIFDAASTKSGNVAPTRTIAGASTGLLLPAAVAVDATKDLLYVADGRDVLVFTASTVNGNVAFTRDIRAGFVIAGMFLDATNNRPVSCRFRRQRHQYL